MANLSSLSAATTTATALSNLLLVSPQNTIGYQPQNTSTTSGSLSILQTPPALLFHYEGEQTVTIESDITDHYIEDNTAIQDQVALKPVVITTHGFIGELNDVAPPLLSLLKTAADKLTVISAYTPALSVTAQNAYNEAFFAYQLAQNAINSAVSAWSSISGTGGESVINGQQLTTQSNQNKQQTYFQQFYGFWTERRLFTVQTPWAVFTDMAIKSLKAIQDAETRMITDFEVSFKQIRTSSVGNSLSANVQARLNSQSAPLVQLGTSAPASSTSLTGGLTQMGVA